MSDEERLSLAALVRSYRSLPPYEIGLQLEQMNKILAFVDKVCHERITLG